MTSRHSRKRGFNSRPLALLTLVSAIVLMVAQPVASAQTPAALPGSTSEFTKAACGAELPAPLVDGENITCGSVNVPAFHAEADGEQFTLNVTVLKSTSDAPAEEPLVILTGGPGQSSAAVLPLFTDDLPVYRPLLERQDVILFDQRGTGLSQPALNCSVDQLFAATPSEGEATPAAALDPAKLQDQTEGCGDEFAEQGIDLSAFTTIESAADVADIAAALDEPQVDLYGISYGTYLGLSVMRDHPELVRSSILASPLPLEENIFSGQVIAFNDSLLNVFAACENDQECAAQFPDLPGKFSKAIADLSKEPLNVDIEDPTTGETIPVPVDAATFSQLLYFSVFAGPLIPAVAPLIATTAAGDPSVLASLLQIVLTSPPSSGTSTGVLNTFFCNDEAPYTSRDEVTSEIESADVMPELADESIFAGVAATTLNLCPAWGVEPEPGNQNDPVVSDIPTLIATGAFDPITPPEYGEEVQANLSNSTLVNLENQGHDPLTNAGDCGVALIETFLEDPEAGPDTACVAEQVLDLTPEESSPEASPES